MLPMLQGRYDAYIWFAVLQQQIWSAYVRTMAMIILEQQIWIIVRRRKPWYIVYIVVYTLYDVVG